jgi:hypothetical protein
LNIFVKRKKQQQQAAITNSKRMAAVSIFDGQGIVNKKLKRVVCYAYRSPHTHASEYPYNTGTIEWHPRSLT